MRKKASNKALDGFRLISYYRALYSYKHGRVVWRMKPVTRMWALGEMGCFAAVATHLAFSFVEAAETLRATLERIVSE